MKYLLLICGEAAVAAQAAASGPMGQGCGGWSEQMRQRGVLRSAVGLRPPGDATTVRVRGDDVLLTDGPFAETKDQIGGFCLIECDDLDEAIDVAARHPVAGWGSIEIRPLWEW